MYKDHSDAYNVGKKAFDPQLFVIIGEGAERLHLLNLREKNKHH